MYAPLLSPYVPYTLPISIFLIWFILRNERPKCSPTKHPWEHEHKCSTKALSENFLGL
jgi:hypothetical protein